MHPPPAPHSAAARSTPPINRFHQPPYRPAPARTATPTYRPPPAAPRDRSASTPSPPRNPSTQLAAPARPPVISPGTASERNAAIGLAPIAARPPNPRRQRLCPADSAACQSRRKCLPFERKIRCDASSSPAVEAARARNHPQSPAAVPPVLPPRARARSAEPLNDRLIRLLISSVPTRFSTCSPQLLLPCLRPVTLLTRRQFPV